MAHFRPGDIIAGEYQVESELGEGGMARVYRCLDLGLHVSVAIKVLKEDYALIPDACARFLQEARTQARLRHVNIMPVQRVLHQGELAAMVMPYVPGRSLADHIDAAHGGVLPEAEALRIFGALLSAVRCAHESTPSVIHRDIKPDNVYLAETSTGLQVLLMDFGIAKVRQDSAVRTQTGTRMGTVAYMAPEQILASKDVGAAADVWSLGVVLYELVCGRRPFESDSDLMLPGVVVHAPVPEDPLRRVSSGLRAVIHRCLEKEAVARYPSVAALEQAVVGFGVEAKRGVEEAGRQAREREEARKREEARRREDARRREEARRRKEAGKRDAAQRRTAGVVSGPQRRTMLLGGLALLLAVSAVGSWLALRPERRERAVETRTLEPATLHPAKPAAAKPAGGALARLAGKWVGDVDALKKRDPEIEQNPMAKMLFAMLATMTVEFTADTLTAEVMGQSKSAKFTVISSTADSLVIEQSDGAAKGKKTEIKFIDHTHISLLEQGEPGPAVVLKRP